MNELKALVLKAWIKKMFDEESVSSEEAGLLLHDLGDIYYEDAGVERAEDDDEDDLCDEDGGDIYHEDQLVDVTEEAEPPDTRHRDAWEWLERFGFHLVRTFPDGDTDFPQYRLKGGVLGWQPKHSSNTPFGAVRQAMAEELAIKVEALGLAARDQIRAARTWPSVDAMFGGILGVPIGKLISLAERAG